MPTFQTPEPISVTLEIGVGDIRITARDGTETTVEVRPTDSANKGDVMAARKARVEFDSGRLLVKSAKEWRQYSPRGGGESIDVRIELPTGSQLAGAAGVASVHVTGRLGECHFKTGVGEIQIDHATGPVDLKTGAGDITVGQTDGPAQITTGTGSLRLRNIGGTGVVKNSNGDTWIGEVASDLRVNAANGKVVVDRAQASVAIKTANGDIRVGEMMRGAIVAETACGSVDLGLRDGVAAWLDVSTRLGTVQNDLEGADRPDAGEEPVEVRARTSFGDITIRRVPSTRTAGKQP